MQVLQKFIAKRQRHTYKFNPHTLSYEKVVVGLRDHLKKVSFTVLFGVVLAVVLTILALQLFDSPQERRLKREIAQYERKMKQLNTRVTRAEQVLTDIEKRDDNVYRTIFEAAPIDQNVRHSGIGGVDRYADLEGYDNTELIKHASERVDDLTKRLYVESKSLDEVYDMAVNKQKRFEAMPAIMPVAKKQCRVVSGFGSRYHPILHCRRIHTGVDLSARKGTPVYATADGTITSAGRTKGFSGYGIVIEIDHGYGFRTLYAHLNDVTGRPGQKVKRGELIGHVGSTGLSSGPHCHYEVIQNGKKVNPVYYFFNDLNTDDYEQMIETANQENQCMS